MAFDKDDPRMGPAERKFWQDLEELGPEGLIEKDLSDISPAGDAQRQAEIDALPEKVEIRFADGEVDTIPFREIAQAEDDAWREFRDSPMYKALMDGWGSGE